MTGRQALGAVNREKHAVAELVAHQPFPTGLDTRPLNVEQSEALLTAASDWTASVPSFLFKHIARRDGGACFTELKGIAEREFLSANPEECAFPVFRLADFLEAAYRSGLIAKNFIAPNGDIYSPNRMVMYEIAPEAQSLLAHYAPTEVETRAETPPTAPVLDTTRIRERLSPIIEHLTERGPSVRDMMLDTLTESAPDETVQTEWDRLEEIIDEGIRAGILAQEENPIGAHILSLVDTAKADSR